MRAGPDNPQINIIARGTQTMSDLFPNRTPVLESPPAGAIPIVPNNGAELTTVNRALNVGTVGDCTGNHA